MMNMLETIIPGVLNNRVSMIGHKITVRPRKSIVQTWSDNNQSNQSML